MNETPFATYLDATSDALANYLGTDDLNEATIELVADCCRQAVAALPNWTYFQDLLEKASTYVQVDMDELEMQDFTGELESQLEDYNII